VPVNRKERDQRPGPVPYYGATGQVGWIDHALFDEELCLLGEDGAPFLDRARPKAYVIDGPSWVNNHAHVLRAAADLTSNRFLKYALDRFDYSSVVNGTTRLKLTKGAMRRMSIPLPPPAEQRRIVAAIEERFSRVDAADESLRHARRRCEALRKLIRSLAAAKGAERFLGDFLEGIEAGKSFKCYGRPADPEEWGVIKVSAMTWGSFAESENKAVISEDQVDPRWEIESGDLLLSRANTTEYVGASVLVRHCRPRLLLSDKSMRLVVRPSIDKEWLQLALSSPQARAQMSAVATGTSDSMRNISQEKVRGIRLRVPPINEQPLIVEAVERQLSVVDAMAAEIDRALARSKALHRSILEQAFSGQLVPQDPSDEPASALLGRIAAERAGSGAPRRSSRRRATLRAQ
jgi:type I restriction enzyme S subunit